MGASSNGTIQCIYCRQHAPPSREHVLQSSLGGNLTIRDVCKPCNTGFSTIDQQLSDHSIVSLTRLMETPDSRQVQTGTTHLIYDPDTQRHLEVRLRNAFTPQLVPQLHHKGGDVILFTASDIQGKEEFTDLLETCIAKGKLGQTHITVDLDCDSPRIAQHRSGQLFVRSRTLEEGQELLEFLRTKWEGVKRVLRGNADSNVIEQPTLIGSLRLDVNSWFRAIAKSAFNYLAHDAGAAYVLAPKFDSIREYINGHIVLPAQVNDGIAVDSRFVSELPKGQPIVFTTESHLIVLLNVGDTLCGIVTLYKIHNFLVRLGPADKTRDVVAHEFSMDSTWNRALSVQEMFTRQRNRSVIRDDT